MRALLSMYAVTVTHFSSPQIRLNYLNKTHNSLIHESEAQPQRKTFFSELCSSHSTANSQKKLSFSFSLTQIPMETAPRQLCHARVECSDAPKANASHHCGCATIKRTVKRARMSFSHASRPSVTMDSLAVANTSSINHIAYHRTTNVIW